LAGIQQRMVAMMQRLVGAALGGLSRSHRAPLRLAVWLVELASFCHETREICKFWRMDGGHGSAAIDSIWGFAGKTCLEGLRRWSVSLLWTQASLEDAVI
jgi:hypothetical protein